MALESFDTLYLKIKFDEHHKGLQKSYSTKCDKRNGDNLEVEEMEARSMLGKIMGYMFTCAEMGLSRVYVWWFGGSEGVPHGPVGYLDPSLRGTGQVDTK